MTDIPLPQYIRVSQLIGTGPHRGERALISVTRQCIYQWIKAGHLPEPIRVGRSIFWRADVILPAIKRLEGSR